MPLQIASPFTRLFAVAGRWRGGRIEGIFLLLVAATAWGIAWPVMKVLLTQLPPFTIRVIAGCVGLAVILGIAISRRESLHLRRGLVAKTILLAMLNYGGFGVFTTLSVLWLRASEAVVITYTFPVWATLLAWPVLGERPSLRGISGMLLAFGGVVGLVGADEIQLGINVLPGVICGFLAAICFGVGAVMAKRRRPELSPVADVAWQIGIGSVPAVVLAAFEHPHFSGLPPFVWVGLGYVSLVSVPLAYLAWFRALRLVPASTAATSILVSPLVGVPSSSVLGDPLGLPQVAALAFMVLGLVMVMSPRRE